MNKKPIFCINDPLAVVCEDLYICNSRGDVLSARSRRSEPITNAFRHLSSGDLSFLNLTLNSYLLTPLLLVESDIGPLFIDVGAFSVSGAILVIVSNIALSDAIFISESCLSGLVTVSDTIKKYTADTREPSSRALLLAQRLKRIYSSDGYGRTGSMGAHGELLAALEMIRGLAEMCGCSAEVSASVPDVCELNNLLCPRRLRAILAALLTIGHKYSGKRRVDIVIGFSELGIEVNVSFDVAREFSDASLCERSTELSDLMQFADGHFLALRYSQKGKEISTVLYPWQAKPESTDLKKDKNHI